MTWIRGQSGNPGGRPKKTDPIKALARKHCKKAILQLVKFMDSEDERVAVMASQAILDRGIGKPTQPVSGDADMPPLRISAIEIRAVDP